MASAKTVYIDKKEIRFFMIADDCVVIDWKDGSRTVYYFNSEYTQPNLARLVANFLTGKKKTISLQNKKKIK